MIRLPRSIRLDASDSFVFAAAAAPGEWAVSGAFVFQGADPDAMSAKSRVALRSGFLGIASLGWSTLVEVAETDAAGLEGAEALLAAQLVAAFGCPDIDTARQAAREELQFAASLCDLPVGTLVAVQRSLQDGAIAERFRTLTRRADRAPPVFALVQSDEPAEAVDLRDLMGDRG